MKKRNFKKFYSFLLAIIFITNVFTFAANAQVNSDYSMLSIDDCTLLGEQWLLENYNDETIIEEVIQITDGLSITSYCINFIKNGLPNGYVVIDADKNAINSVIEFCLSGEDIYDTLSNNYKGQIDNQKTKIIYSTGLYDYAIPINNGKTLFYNSTNITIDKSTAYDLCKYAKEAKDNFKKAFKNQLLKYLLERDPNLEDNLSYLDGFFTSGTIESTGTYSSKTIRNAASFIPSVMSDFRAEGEYTGNCAPTAATNIVSYFKENRGFSLIPGDRQDIYDAIVSASGWDKNGSIGMSISTANTAIKAVAENNTYSYSSSSYWFDLWSDWVDDLDNEHPVLTGVRGSRQDSDGNWIEVGHAIVAIGYREYESGARYFRVLDGWNANNNRYIWFNSEYFDSIDGIGLTLVR